MTFMTGIINNPLNLQYSGRVISTRRRVGSTPRRVKFYIEI